MLRRTERRSYENHKWSNNAASPPQRRTPILARLAPACAGQRAVAESAAPVPCLSPSRTNDYPEQIRSRSLPPQNLSCCRPRRRDLGGLRVVLGSTPSRRKVPGQSCTRAHTLRSVDHACGRELSVASESGRLGAANSCSINSKTHLTRSGHEFSLNSVRKCGGSLERGLWHRQSSIARTNSCGVRPILMYLAKSPIFATGVDTTGTRSA